MKKKTKILMITPYLPCSQSSGGQTRSFNLLKHISQKCDITLISFILPDQDRDQIKKLKKFCKKIITISRGKTWNLKKILFTGFTFYPFLVSNYYSGKLKKIIKSELKNKDYNLIHVECFYLMPNVPRSDIPILLVDQTIEFAVYKHFVDNLSKKFFLIKSLLKIDVLKLKFWENHFWKKADCLVAVSEDDKKLMNKMADRKIQVIKNGVSKDLMKNHQIKKTKYPSVLFGVANFKWMQNKEGAKNLIRFVWPKIRKALPKTKLFIIGRYSTEFVRSLGITKNNKDNIIFKEIKKPEQAYCSSWVLTAPMKSRGGSRTKFFEAMACGLPIVTTKQGIEGIKARHNKEVVIGNFDDLADLTIKLIKNKKKRRQIAKLEKKLVKENYSWQASAENLLEVYGLLTNNL